MTSTPLILTLTVLTATILALLILWVFIRYTKDRRARHSQRAQLEQDASSVAEHNEAGRGESQIHLQCTYQPSGAPHGNTHGVELETLTRAKRVDSGEKAETWLRKGSSRDNLRSEGFDGNDTGVVENSGMVKEEEGDASGTKTVKVWGRGGDAGAWDMVGGRSRADGLEGAGRG